MVVKVNMEFKLLPARKIASDQLLMLNLKNRGNRILKNLVVQLHSATPGFSADCAKCFVYALMPSAEETVKFQVSLSSLARAYFSVSGYSSGDAYFSTKSPLMNVRTRKSIENSVLLM